MKEKDSFQIYCSVFLGFGVGKINSAWSKAVNIQMGEVWWHFHFSCKKPQKIGKCAKVILQFIYIHDQ